MYWLNSDQYAYRGSSQQLMVVVNTRKLIQPKTVIIIGGITLIGLLKHRD